ncbi:MAG: ATPase domain-containing protein [Nanoarchaeota archaeon]
MPEAFRVESREEASQALPEAMPKDFNAVKGALDGRPTESPNPSISLTTGKVLEGRKPMKQRPEYLIERIPSGIGGLDDEIEGGFIKKSVNLVSGSPGAGKTIFAIQFLVEACRKGEAALFISFEEKEDNVYKYMAKFGWDLKEFEEEKKFFFLRYSPQQVYKLLSEGGGTVENIIKTNKVTRVAIDSITAFTLMYKDELQTREALLALFEMIAGWHCTTLLTAEQESDPEKHKPSVVEFEVDGVVLLYNFRTRQNIRQRVAEILKMRGTRFPQRIFPMKIEDNGITFYPREVAF